MMGSWVRVPQAAPAPARPIILSSAAQVDATAAGMSILDAQMRDLAQLSRHSRRRRLMPRAGHDFASNDYLGLASAPGLRAAVAEALARGVPVGSGGSRLLRGNHEEHEALEAHAARHYGSEAALFFATGFAANAALFATLPQRGDLIVHDELIQDRKSTRLKSSH